ncbi:MAG: DUF3172 domain-containing protein [Chroococcus sp. CMT-3BRIN-NPC107]|jgi:hypothetical protein|nr:DUF3172 domain-containing protein [Chroococcus sp. CMT-3BRIN-NPC107]
MKRKSGRSAVTEKKTFAFLPTSINYATIAILAAALIMGIGIGTLFASDTGGGENNVSSSIQIDQKAPNPEICIQYGASAMVMDARLFVTLRPFKVYVSQPTMRPGCVLRQSNWAVLEQRNLVTGDQVRDCRQKLNTFGFTGDLGNSPAISCIYQSEDAQNFFINQPGAVNAPTNTEQF